jgi:hypothetical protein
MLNSMKRATGRGPNCCGGIHAEADGYVNGMDRQTQLDLLLSQLDQLEKQQQEMKNKKQ